jgi:hypothetical protein
MTELELTIRAKQVIDKLANGFDPYNNTELPDDVLLNDPRLIRCFYHVSKKLDEIISNGGEVGKRDEKNLPPFTITEEQKSKIAISETPLAITHFVDRINEAVDISVMKKCKTTVITEWLVEKGFFNEVVINDKRRKIVTGKCAAVGIFEEERQSFQGFTYRATLYSAEAQRFILDNLNEMFAERES